MSSSNSIINTNTDNTDKIHFSVSPAPLIFVHVLCSASCHAYPSHMAHRGLRHGCTVVGPPLASCWPPIHQAPEQEGHHSQSPPGAGLSSPSCRRHQAEDERFSAIKFIFMRPYKSSVLWVFKVPVHPQVLCYHSSLKVFLQL